MLKRSNFVYRFLQVITWIIFVGLSIEAGALIVNFIFSLFKPEVVKNLYEKLDLSQMYERSQWAYFGMYGFVLVISILKANLFYEVIRLTYKFDLAKPFNNFVSKQVTRISYYTLSIGLLSVLARQTSENLQKRGFEIDTLNKFWADGQAYIMMAAIIYVIATIIAKGVELQNENDLTI